MMLSSAYEIRCYVARYDTQGVGEILYRDGKPITFGSYQQADVWIQKQGDKSLSPTEVYYPRRPTSQPSFPSR